uniref:Uncharacterized protein n=1 Tax=Quercus lobata TaxID=97700 RepID=A0A7N2KQ10_QUELO
MMKFESGYTVETLFDGSKLSIEPYSVEVLPGGELLVLDSANSNLYRISASLSLCECLFCFVYDMIIFCRKVLQAACGLHQSWRKARQVLNAFHKIECRMQNLPIEHLEVNLQKYHDLKTDLSRTERHIFKEMGFVCHVEHPHKFISNYLAILKTPPELRLEAWNLANDSICLSYVYVSGKCPAISCAWSFGDYFSNQPLNFQLGLYKMMLWRVLLNKFKHQCCRFGLAIV